MKSHKNRLNKLDAQLPPDEDENVITIIRLAWPEDEVQPPVTYRRGVGGRIIKKVGIDSVPAHLRGEPISVCWNEDELDVEELLGS